MPREEVGVVSSDGEIGVVSSDGDMGVACTDPEVGVVLPEEVGVFCKDLELSTGLVIGLACTNVEVAEALKSLCKFSAAAPPPFWWQLEVKVSFLTADGCIGGASLE